MLNKLGKKGLVVLAAAGVLFVVAVVGAILEWWWLAVAAVALLQLVVLLILLLVQSQVGKPFSAIKTVDSLSERMLAALETERLCAADRHAEVLKHLGGDPQAPGA